MNTLRAVYLDYAAATPVAEHVLTAMTPYFSELFYNPSSPYAPAVAVRRSYESAKASLARTIGAKGDELVMTAGATESINLAFSGVEGHVVTTAIEHPAVLEAARQHDHTLVPVSDQGIVDPEMIRASIRSDTELVSISLGNSELGSLQPLKAIAYVVMAERTRRSEMGDSRRISFHSDASQGFGLVDIHVARLGVDLLTLNAAKVYGPKQVGLLWVKSSSTSALTPTIHGGGQERGLRSGTENVAGVIGFSEAAVWAEKHRAHENARLKKLRDELESLLIEAHPNAKLLGSRKRRLPNFISIAYDGLDAERLIFILEKEGIYVATGSACSANKNTASHVLRAINVEDSFVQGSLRITLGKPTSKQDIELAGAAIIAAVSAEYERVGKR